MKLNIKKQIQKCLYMVAIFAIGLSGSNIYCFEDSEPMPIGIRYMPHWNGIFIKVNASRSNFYIIEARDLENWDDGWFIIANPTRPSGQVTKIKTSRKLTDKMVFRIKERRLSNESLYFGGDGLQVVGYPHMSSEFSYVAGEIPQITNFLTSDDSRSADFTTFYCNDGSSVKVNLYDNRFHISYICQDNGGPFMESGFLIPFP